ncbi:uncharacterized protein LOC131663907 [Phymastichus coffea]|uniref:uncharacterized protein LOC131663907 n=1 Tax=Phymastichus coffea TaxID=108790 RepID=UPI00273A79CA|nr:uncharacterized protein LOC131663907 [Phymastichus coffea]
MEEKPNRREILEKSVESKKKKWTETEKKTLLKGLQAYGPDDICKLKQILPNKSSLAIQQMIEKYRAMADLGKKDINSPLDIWLRSGLFNKEHQLVPEALLFISLFEDHPPPEETAGFDLKQAYNLLYEATKGQITSSISRKTGEMFRDLILTLDKEIWPSNESETTDYLVTKLTSGEAERTYRRKRRHENS